MDPITGFLINFIIGLVLSVASTLLQQAFAPKNDSKKATGTRGSTQIGGKVPQYFLVGTVADAGKREYRNSWGTVGGVPNANLVDVYSFGDLPITALSGLYANGVRVALSGTAIAQGKPSPDYNNGADHLWALFSDGKNTVVNSYLASKFGADADRPWTSDMVGRGVPYLITTALWDEKLWTSAPSFVGEFQGIPLYDPRQDTTAGGSGSQRWADQATWAFSDNNAVIIYNILRGIYYGGARVWGGDATEAQLTYAVWAAAMNACDEAVTLVAGGTEKRFRAGRKISLSERPADVIKELLIGANARIHPGSDGVVDILVGVPAAVDGAFSDADVLASEAIGSIPFPNLDQIINGASATYREPLQAWEDKETAPYFRSDYEADDDGRRQIEGLDLGTTFSGTQAQRVLQATVEEGRRFLRHVVALPPEFAQYRPLQILEWTSASRGYVAKRFLITIRTRAPFGNVIFGLQEIDPTDHNWVPGTDESPLTFAPVVTNRPAPQSVSGFYVAPAIALDSAGRDRRPAIDAFWDSTSVSVDVRAVRITVRLDEGGMSGTGALVWEGEAPVPVTGSARLTEALVPNNDYEVQIQYMPFSGRVTVESSWLTVTTPDVKLGPLDVVYGDIDLDALGTQFNGLLDWMGSNVRDLIEQAQAQAVLTGDQELANASQFDEMRRSVSTVVGDLSASFDETITTAIIPMQGQLVAFADALTQLTAADGTDINTARMRWTVQTGPVGYSTIGIEARSDTADPADFRTAGIYIRTPNNPADPTELFLDAERLVFGDLSSGAVINPLVYDTGVWRMNVANIGTITAGRIQNPANTSYFDLTGNAFRIST